MTLLMEFLNNEYYILVKLQQRLLFQINHNNLNELNKKFRH